MQDEGRPSPPRILLGFDATRGSDRAVALLRSVAWPAGTRIRVASSPAGVGQPLSGFASRRAFRDEHERVRDLLRTAQVDVGLELAASGLSVDRALIEGRATPAIDAEAARFGATLAVVGSRGFGSLRSWLLGSVSADLIQRASCSILVCREAAARRVLLVGGGDDTGGIDPSVLGPLLADAQIRTLDPPADHAAGAIALAVEAWRADLVVLAGRLSPDGAGDRAIARRVLLAVGSSLLVGPRAVRSAATVRNAIWPSRPPSAHRPASTVRPRRHGV